jgi:hypothetical protein
MGFVFIKQFIEFSVCILVVLTEVDKNTICLSCHLDQVEAFIERVVNTTYSLLQIYYTENSKQPRNETAWPHSQFLHSCICENI